MSPAAFSPAIRSNDTNRSRESMDEHDDDLTSEVQEDASEEVDAFPTTEEDVEADRFDDDPFNVDPDQS